MSNKLKDFVLNKERSLTVLAVDKNGDILGHLSFFGKFQNQSIETKRKYLKLGLQRLQQELEKEI